jgi:hypothetical protein
VIQSMAFAKMINVVRVTGVFHSTGRQSYVVEAITLYRSVSSALQTIKAAKLALSRSTSEASFR